MIELNIKIESKDLYDFMLRHTYNSAQGIIGSCVGALLIVYAFMEAQWITLPFGLIILLYLPGSLYLRSKQQILMNPGFQEPLCYVLDDEGMTVSQKEDSVKFLWSDIYKVVSTGRSIIVYTSAINATIFPKAKMGDKTAAVIEILSTHLPAKKVKIRG